MKLTCKEITDILNSWHCVEIKEDDVIAIDRWCISQLGKPALTSYPDYDPIDQVWHVHTLYNGWFNDAAIWESSTSRYEDLGRQKFVYAFKNQNDAIHFKLRWG